MVIKYRGHFVAVEVIRLDEQDDYQPRLFSLPEGHEMYLPEGVWIPVRDYKVVMEEV